MRVRSPLQIVPIAIANLILFVALHPLFRGDVATLALIPVGAVGSAYGTLPGVGAGVAAILTHTLLVNLLGTPGWDAIVRENAVLGSAVVLVVGAFSGSVRDLDRALSQANSRLAAEGERLQLDLTSREEYMSVVAHELRNPLVGMRAASRMLAGRLSGEDRTMGEAIAAEAARGLQLIDGLTDAASISSGRLRSALVPLDLAELVRSTVHGIEDLGQRLTMPAADLKLPVLGDERRLRQVIDNLVSNAVKYSPPNAPIEVSIGRSADRASAIVTVRDHGPGIPPAERKRLFQRFARLTTAQGVPGSGLRLYIYKGIVEDHHGSRTADWPPGGGTAFSVTSPTAPAL